MIVHEIFKFTSKWFWLLMIIVTTINAASFWNSGRSDRKKDPTLSVGYSQIFWWTICMVNLPWILMGIAQLSGEVKYGFEVFDVRGAGLFVKSMYILIVLEAVLFNYFIFIQDGAEFLSRHTPGIFWGAREDYSRNWKFLAIFTLLLNITAVIGMWYFAPDDSFFVEMMQSFE